MPSTGSVINRKALLESVIAMALLMPGMLLFPLGISLAMCLFIYGVMLGFLVALLMDLRRAMLMQEPTRWIGQGGQMTSREPPKELPNHNNHVDT
jgi:hypothetical protein